MEGDEHQSTPRHPQTKAVFQQAAFVPSPGSAGKQEDEDIPRGSVTAVKSPLLTSLDEQPNTNQEKAFLEPMERLGRRKRAVEHRTLRRIGNDDDGSEDVLKLTPTSRAKKYIPVHVCDTCKPAKTFTRAEHLRIHQLNHQKPAYPCTFEDCERAFRKPDLLARHINRHKTEGEKTYKRGVGVDSEEVPLDGERFSHGDQPSAASPIERVLNQGEARMTPDYNLSNPGSWEMNRANSNSSQSSEGYSSQVSDSPGEPYIYYSHGLKLPNLHTNWLFPSPTYEPPKPWNSSFFHRTYSKIKSFRRKAIRVVVNGKECFARPDSASDRDIMTEAFAQDHNIPVHRGEEDKSIFMLGVGNYIQSVGRAYVPFKLFGGGGSEEHRWFHVLKKCPVPLIMGMSFLEKIRLYTKNKHLLVDCPHSFGSMPTLKWIGSPRGHINFKANGKKLVGCADTGSDLDFISLQCARRLGLKINTEPSARTRVMLADESVVETVGQAHISSVELSYFDSFEMTLHVLPGLASDVIFSEDFLEQMDAFNTCAQIEDSEDPYQQRLNTLINLGPIQAFLSRTWATDVTDTAQQEHDRVIEAEIYRRNNVKRSIRKLRDANQASTARAAEEIRKRTFDTGHDRCIHCIGKRHDMGTQD